MKEFPIKAFVTSFALIFAIYPFQCEEVSKKEAPEEELAISQKLVNGLEFILQTDKMLYRAERERSE